MKTTTFLTPPWDPDDEYKDDDDNELEDWNGSDGDNRNYRCNEHNKTDDDGDTEKTEEKRDEVENKNTGMKPNNDSYSKPTETLNITKFKPKTTSVFNIARTVKITDAHISSITANEVLLTRKITSANLYIAPQLQSLLRRSSEPNHIFI